MVFVYPVTYHVGYGTIAQQLHPDELLNVLQLGFEHFNPAVSCI
jgi:hypothetical protein